MPLEYAIDRVTPEKDPITKHPIVERTGVSPFDGKSPTYRMLIETFRTILPTCPHCGHDHQDSYFEFNLKMEEWTIRECDECGKEFEVEMETLYSTRKVGEGI